MTSREAILQSLRNAAPAPLPRPGAPADAEVFSDMPGDLAAAFTERLQALHGEVYLEADLAAAARRLLALSPPGGRGLIQPDPWLSRLLELEPELATRLAPPATDLASPAMAEYGMGVTRAECLVARTGSILVRTDTCGGRRLSVLPPLHVVVAAVDQIVPSLEEAFARLGNGNDAWSFGSLITGPSRTADIEKILVLGAHGPKRLAVILVVDSEG